MFNLTSSFQPTGDQPQAIANLENGVKLGLKNQVLLGVTGSGKTFTMANVIADLKMPALVISHNKTLAGQLYQEMRDFFPNNAVSYFVSYYDYYQPEAYIPQTDTYIEKEAQINELIDKLRLQSTTNLLTRNDVIVVASVSCIYNIGSPVEYGNFILNLSVGQEVTNEVVSRRLAQLQYVRSEFEFKRGTFRLRGQNLDIYPAYADFAYRIVRSQTKITEILRIHPVLGEKLGEKAKIAKIVIYPAKHYMMATDVLQNAESQIRDDLKKEVDAHRLAGRLLEAERLTKKVNFDLEMIKEVGYVNGIENYSRYFDGRNPGDPPYTLIDYFKKSYGEDFLLFIDESHMTVPQLRGMYHGDYSRKKILTEFGFRLKAAFDNRPLNFAEFYSMFHHLIYVSATPDSWETDLSLSEARKNNVPASLALAEQLIRPTGIVDPQIEIKDSDGEIADLIKEIEKRVVKKEKVLVTTLTKRTAEDLASYLKDKNIKASYLHSDVQTLDRSDILDNLRRGTYDVLIGVNLLREGLDLPEVALVAILDADKEGFLRSKTALIQTMGRAARNIYGKVIIYAKYKTKSITAAVSEIQRRRKRQENYNKINGINPKTILKPIREKIAQYDEILPQLNKTDEQDSENYLSQIDWDALTPYDRRKTIKKLKSLMVREANDLNFEAAIKIRDKVREVDKRQ